MHFYTHNIGEFAIDTKFMSFEEKGIYVELVDRYLATGKPLASDWLATIKRFASEGAVEAVLATCFVRDGDVYRSERLDRMIEDYEIRSEKNQENARKPRKKAEKSMVDSELAIGKRLASESLTTNNQEPITNNQETSTTEEPSAKKRAPLVSLPAELPDEWEASALEARADVDPGFVFGKLKARYAGTTTRKALATWRREFLNWIGREFARAPAQPVAKKVERFDEAYYKDVYNPDGSINWGL